MDKLTTQTPDFQEIVDQIQKSSVPRPQNERNQTEHTIDDLLASVRYLSTKNTYNTIEDTTQNLQFIDSYPIDIDERRGRITVRRKNQDGYVFFIDKKNEIHFNGENHASIEEPIDYEIIIHKFFTLTKELYATDNDITDILYQREKEYTLQHPKSALSDAFSREKPRPNDRSANMKSPANHQDDNQAQ